MKRAIGFMSCYAQERVVRIREKTSSNKWNEWTLHGGMQCNWGTASACMHAFVLSLTFSTSSFHYHPFDFCYSTCSSLYHSILQVKNPAGTAKERWLCRSSLSCTNHSPFTNYHGWIPGCVLRILSLVVLPSSSFMASLLLKILGHSFACFVLLLS